MTRHVRKKELKGAEVSRSPLPSPEQELAFLLREPIPKAYDRSKREERREWKRKLRKYKTYREKNGIPNAEEIERFEAEKSRELFSSYSHWYAQRAKLEQLCQGLLTLMKSDPKAGLKKLRAIINRDKH